MAAGVGILWSLNLKINSDQKGFNEKYWIAEKTEADAKTASLAICAQRLKLLPTNAEIFFATMSKNNSTRDSRFLHTGLGVGTYQFGDPTPVDTEYDYAGTSLLIRMENESGSSFSRKICCVPDNIVEGGTLVSSVSPVTSTPLALPAADAVDATWYAKMNRFMALLCFYTHHVQSDHAPGGPYTYFAFTSAFAMRIAQKKGARHFI